MKDKVVFITGASSGLGAAVAIEASRQGAIIVVTGRNLERLNMVAAELPGEHTIITLDVTEMLQIEQAIAAAVLKYGRIDIIVNNAGYGKFTKLEDMTVAEYESMMNTNYFGIVRCVKAILPYFKNQGFGHIVNVASMAGKIGTAKSTAYSASKHAALGFTNALRSELRGGRIKVSAVNPGPMDTPFFDTADPSGEYAQSVKSFMLDTKKAARKTVKLMATGKAELDLPLAAAIGIKLYGLFPRLADKIAGGLFNRK